MMINIHNIISYSQSLNAFHIKDDKQTRDKTNLFHKIIITLFPIVSLALLYFFAGKLSLLFLHGHSIINIGLFASEGISLGFILYFGKKVWSGIFIGQFMLAFSNDISLYTSLGISLINSLEAIVGYILFYKFKFDINLKTFRDIFGLTSIILFIQLLSAYSSNVLLLLDGVIINDNFFSSTFSWWFGNVMGQLLFTPFLLLLFINNKAINFIEYSIYSFLFASFIYLIEIVLNITNALLLLSFSIPIIVFIVSYKSFFYGLGMSVILAIISSYSLYLGQGAFNNYDTINNIINYNLYILAHISIVFITGILFEERKQNILLLKNQVIEEVHKNKEKELLLVKQSKFAQMGEMIAMIAHQWRQPLNNLALSNQLLVSKYNKGKLDNETMDMFKINSKKQITHMSKTIDDFRNFFREDQIKKDFSVNNVINDLMHITQNIYTNYGIELNFNTKEEFLSNGYPNELGQAILNIINNAKDALLDINIKNKYIKISLYKQNSTLIISIEDNAGGIKDDISEKIFNPYFSTKKTKNGTGLGLYMTKRIIMEKFQGDIKFTNTKHGVNFKILLKDLKNAS